MIVVVLICTLIGYLCGSALVGLLAGLALFALVMWVDRPTLPRARKPKRLRRRP